MKPILRIALPVALATSLLSLGLTAYASSSSSPAAKRMRGRILAAPTSESLPPPPICPPEPLEKCNTK
jgi:hypothetical protein